MTTIRHEANTEIRCGCGNTTDTDGFFPCDENGHEIEPTAESNWNGLYVCPVCQQTHAFEEEQ